MQNYSTIPSHELAAVTGGLGVREAAGNAVFNVKEWGRVVYGRQSELNKFVKQPDMSLDQYVENLKRFDAQYKPVIPNQW